MKKPVLIIIILLLISMVSMVGVSSVYAIPTALYVDPPSIIDTTKTAGTTFSVNINVKEVTDLMGYEFILNYTTAVLTATEITLGPFFPPDSMIWHEEINDTLGYVWYAVTMPFGSQVGKTGSGTLATISFLVDSSGASPLYLYYHEIKNSKANPIPHKVYDGYFSNIPRPTKLYVDPASIINPDLVPGENFTINVNILNATNLHSSEFKLDYDTALLDANVTEGDFLKSSGLTNFTLNINETLGFLWVNVTLFDPLAGATGDGTLARVTFNVTAIGDCVLDLYDTKLVDSEGEWIEHDKIDGYFSNKLIIHDVAITDVTTTVTTVEVIDNVPFPVVKPVSEVHAGEKVNITVHVKNNGSTPETFHVTAYYDNTTISTKNVTELSDGFTKTLTFEWSTEGVAEDTYTIWAEASVVAGETNTANNKFTKEGQFAVLPGGQLFSTELVVAAIVVIIIAAAITIYFIKIRKPKPD